MPLCLANVAEQVGPLKARAHWSLPPEEGLGSDRSPPLSNSAAWGEFNISDPGRPRLAEIREVPSASRGPYARGGSIYG